MRRKKVSLIFKSANYLGMALTLYAFAGIIALEIGYYSNFVNLFVVFPVYFLGQILQAFAYAGKKAKKTNRLDDNQTEFLPINSCTMGYNLNISVSTFYSPYDTYRTIYGSGLLLLSCNAFALCL